MPIWSCAGAAGARDKSPRAEAARKLASNWRRRLRVNDSVRTKRDFGRSACPRLSRPRVAAAAIHRAKAGSRSAAAASASIPPHRSPAAHWLAVGEVAGHASGARILSAAAIDEARRARSVRRPHRNPPRRRLRSGDRLGHADSQPPPRRDPAFAAVPTRTPDPARDRAGAARWRARAWARLCCRGTSARRQLLHRATSPAASTRRSRRSTTSICSTAPTNGLPPLLAGKRRLGDIPPAALDAALEQLLGYEHAASSTGSPRRNSPARRAAATRSIIPRLPGPTVEVRAQALFGLARHPTVAGGQVPLVLAITSPAGRPIQTTTDLPGFWAGSWRDVAKDMRGRYPKHPWPDDPASAAPTLRTKRARDALIRLPLLCHSQPMTVARISELERKTTQSGKANAGRWLLEFERQEAAAARSADRLERLRRHQSAGAASPSRPRKRRSLIATSTGSITTSCPAPPVRLKLQAYADNFR